MRPARLALPALGGALGYLLVIRGDLTVDLGVGRRVRPLGPIRVSIAAQPETVFDVIADPYLGKTPRAMQGKIRVLERGADMVLAAHYTEVGPLTTTTVETVRFERPNRIFFRLLRGPVPHVVESFELKPCAEGTELEYVGELGADLWRLGEWWAERVADHWERAVAASLETTRGEAERRAGP